MPIIRRSSSTPALACIPLLLTAVGLPLPARADASSEADHLGDLPVVGGLFRSESRSNSTRAVSAALRPKAPKIPLRVTCSAVPRSVHSSARQGSFCKMTYRSGCAMSGTYPYFRICSVAAAHHVLGSSTGARVRTTVWLACRDADDLHFRVTSRRAPAVRPRAAVSHVQRADHAQAGPHPA